MVPLSQAQSEISTASGSSRHLASEPPRKRAVGLLVVLGALTAIAPLATDMYVPGFPSMGESLRTNSSSIQLTMTTFLVGLVIGQLVFGPLSDSLGRRKLLIAGSAGFVLFSTLCALAPSVQVLLAARLLQGVAGAVGMVLARAVITDLFDGAEVPRYFAVLSQILGVAPVAAPVLGGVILAVASWQIIFVVLALIGAALVLSIMGLVPESLPAEKRNGGGLGSAFRAMGTLLRNRSFMGYVLVLGFAAAALFVYISGSSFVFENLHGVSSTTYSLIFAVNAIGMLVSGTLFGKLVHKVLLNTLLSVGLTICLVGAIAQVLAVALLGETLIGSWICLFVTAAGIGMVFPATMSLGQALGRRAPGASSALMGGSQFGFGAIASPLVGVFGEDSSLPMATIMLVAASCGVLALITLARPWNRHGEHRV
ncbi:multidrug effflux MFS transporter [Streptomyces sp. SDT5-1]|uniref:multidrug effflux MFS transporter n=1 Tax=Streptomyces sp. SDT5-1 TaxID=3406418 RepID=UPI003FD145A5